MRISSLAIAASLGALALSACAKDDDTANSTNVAVAPLGPGEVALSPADLPRPKAGYWEEVDTSGGATPHARHFCASGKPFAVARLARACGTFAVKRAVDGAIVMDAVCSKGVISSALHATSRGDFTTSYEGDTTMTMTIAGHASHGATRHVVGRYLGACPAAMTPDG